jgi:hypothetical protein
LLALALVLALVLALALALVLALVLALALALLLVLRVLVGEGWAAGSSAPRPGSCRANKLIIWDWHHGHFGGGPTGRPADRPADRMSLPARTGAPRLLTSSSPTL